MFTRRGQSRLFVRLDPGERLVEGLKQAFREGPFGVGAIVSGVGMLTQLQLGFFEVEVNDYRLTRFGDEIFDLSCVAGNVVLRDGNPWPHVHVVANRRDYSTVSGHLIEAECHITVELFMELAEDLGINRRVLPGVPATRLCPLDP